MRVCNPHRGQAKYFHRGFFDCDQVDATGIEELLYENVKGPDLFQTLVLILCGAAKDHADAVSGCSLLYAAREAEQPAQVLLLIQHGVTLEQGPQPASPDGDDGDESDTEYEESFQGFDLPTGPDNAGSDEVVTGFAGFGIMAHDPGLTGRAVERGESGATL